MTKQRPPPQVSLRVPQRSLELSVRNGDLHGLFSRIKDMAEPGKERGGSDAH